MMPLIGWVNSYPRLAHPVSTLTVSPASEITSGSQVRRIGSSCSGDGIPPPQRKADLPQGSPTGSERDPLVDGEWAEGPEEGFAFGGGGLPVDIRGEVDPVLGRHGRRLRRPVVDAHALGDRTFHLLDPELGGGDAFAAEPHGCLGLVVEAGMAIPD